MSNMHNPAHPGEVLREYLPEGVSIGEVAKRPPAGAANARIERGGLTASIASRF